MSRGVNLGTWITHLWVYGGQLITGSRGLFWVINCRTSVDCIVALTMINCRPDVHWLSPWRPFNLTTTTNNWCTTATFTLPCSAVIKYLCCYTSIIIQILTFSTSSLSVSLASCFPSRCLQYPHLSLPCASSQCQPHTVCICHQQYSPFYQSTFLHNISAARHITASAPMPSSR